MARPVRIEFEGAFYHAILRGNNRHDLFIDEGDRQSFIKNLGRVARRIRWWAWA